MATMRAVVITGVGGADVLEVREVPRPEPAADEVRARVRAAGVNRADLMQCRGHYPAPKGAPPDIPGLEFAGEIDSLGSGVSGSLQVGDRVFGIVGGGGQAEYVVTHERMVVKVPDNLGWDEAGGVPEVFITAHDALERQGGLRPGESVLVHAVGSGVGTAAVQVARAMGCRVLGTSRTASKLARARELGMDIGIDTSGEEPFDDVVLRETGGAGVDVVLDLIGAPVLPANLRALSSQGRLVVAGLLGGGTGTIDLSAVLRRRVSVVGTTLRARPLEQKIQATRRFAASVVPWLERGLARPVVDRVLGLDDIRAAQHRLESNLGFGKVVLRV